MTFDDLVNDYLALRLGRWNGRWTEDGEGHPHAKVVKGMRRTIKRSGYSVRAVLIEAERRVPGITPRP